MAWLILMAGLRDLRRDDGLSDLPADVLGDGMSELSLEYQLKQLNERHMEYAAGLQAKIAQLEQQLETEWVAKLRDNARANLAEEREASVSNAFIQAQADLKDAHEQLAAERALADALAERLERKSVFTWCKEDDEAIDTYRKARGME